MREWRDIKGYEGLYKVSSDGLVMRIPKKLRTNATYRQRILKPDKVTGYLRVSLSKDNVRKNYLIHRLVASAFCGGNDDTLQVNHKDFNRTNNDYRNLEWVTRQENIDHFCSDSDRLEKRNKQNRGMNAPRNKLSLEDARLIIKLHKEYGILIKTVAALFGVGRNLIGFVINGKHWASEYCKEVS